MPILSNGRGPGSALMIGLYILAAIVGGILVLVNVMTGGHGHEFDTDTHIEVGHGASDAAHHSFWLPFFSIRFWTYFFATAGLTGLLLTWFTKLAETAVLGASISTGIICGLVVALAVRFLSRYDSDSAAKMEDMLGAEAQVLVAVRKTEPGKVRCHLRGDTMDLLALAQDEVEIPPGAGVVIVSVDGDRVTVVPRSELYG